MIDLTVGQIVFSKCGHDKGKAYIIISKSDEYLYLADGDIRTLKKTKKKKIKHVQITNYVLEQIADKLKKNQCTDADLKKALKPYKSKFLAKEV